MKASVFEPGALAAIGAILGLALLLRLHGLDQENFWIDEVDQVQNAGLPLADILQEFSPRANGGPLSLMITHAFLSPGTPEWSARLPSALLGTAGVLATILVGRQLLPLAEALLAGVLLAVSPLHVWYSQEARWYAPWVFVATVSYLVLVRALRSNGVLAWLAYGLVALAGVYTFVLSFFVLCAQGVTAWALDPRVASRRWPPSAVSFTLALLLALVAAAPVVWMIVTHLHATTGTARPDSAAALPYILFAFGVGFSLGPSLTYLHDLPSVAHVATDYPEVLAIGAVFAAVLALGIVRLGQRREARAVLLPWLCIPPVLAFALASVTNIVFELRYALAALPAFVLVLAQGIAAPRSHLLRGIAGGAVLGCCALSLHHYYRDARFDKDDVRGALALIAATPKGESPIVVVGQIGPAARYYGSNLRLETPIDCEPRPDGEEPLRRSLLADAPALWLVAGRDWSGAASGCLGRLSPAYVTVRHEHLTGVELWLLERPSS